MKEQKISFSWQECQLPLYTSLFLFVFSILFNTSFHYMGVDLEKEFSSFFRTQYIWYILQTNLKIFLLYIAFITPIMWNVMYLWHRNKKKTLYTGLYTSLILTFLWFSSIVSHPQLYGEFFYLRHSYALPLLYALTDNFSPNFFSSIVYLLLVTPLLRLLYLAILRKDPTAFYLICLFGGFLLFHINGNSIGILGLLLAFFFAQKYLTHLTIRNCIFLIAPFILFAGYQTWQHWRPTQNIQSNKFPIFIIATDSLRADRLGFQRNGVSITPHIDTMQNQAWSFNDHHVSIARTFPSWADSLTGRYGMEHGIMHMFPSVEARNNLGNRKFPTIGHVLQKKGYQTAVFSNFAGDVFPRADFGFADVFAPNFNAITVLIQKNLDIHFLLYPILTGSFFTGGEYFPEINGMPTFGDSARLLKQLKRYIKKHKSSPLFVTSFFSATHFPYSPPYPFYNKFSKNYHGKYKYFKFVDPSVSSKPKQNDVQQIRNVFDASIATFDQTFGNFIQILKEENLYENSLILLTGDHGESIYEFDHGHGHGEHLRGENVSKVPLLLKLPNSYRIQNLAKQGVYSGVTSSLDIVPTLLDILQLASPNLEGKSLLKLAQRPQEKRFVYSETGVWFSDRGEHFFQKQRIPYPNILKLHRVVPEENYQIMITNPKYNKLLRFAKHRAILSSNFKLIYIPTPNGVTYELFHRQKDPGNLQNLWSPQHPEGKEMRDHLHSLVSRYGASIIEEYIHFPDKF
ncbi:MAG: sulfatase-like hydrolase/transferase [Spirochaetota bacterium]